MHFRGLFFCLSLVVLFACKKVKDRYPDTELGGHAGAGLHISSSNYHDNSLEAYEYACSYSEIKMIELDIQLSADHTWWLFHDLELSVESSGKGNIPEASDAYLSTLRYETLEREKLVRLLDLPSDLHGRTLLLDVKEVKGTGLIDSAAMIQALIQAKNYFTNGKLALVSNGGRYLETLSSLGFEIYLNAQNATDYLSIPNHALTQGALFRNAAIEAEDIEKLQAVSKKSIIYDVRSPKGIRRALKKKPAVLLADDIKATIIEKYK